MREPPSEDDHQIQIYRHLSDRAATLLRAAIADLGFPPHCSFKACRRSRSCSTRDLLCWQVNHEEMNQAITLATARRWRQGPKPGEDWPDWSPEQIRTFEWVLAEEAAGERDGLRKRIVGQVDETTS